MSPIRILHVLATLDRGGAESMLMSLYRNIDKDRFQFDFVVNDDKAYYAFEDEIKALGGHVYRMPRYKLYNHFSYRKAYDLFFKANHPWPIIHGHYTTAAAAYLTSAKKLGKKTIAHSHATRTTYDGLDNRLLGLFVRFSKILTLYPLRFLPDYLFACSVTAGKFMFGAKRPVTIINNAVDITLFKYDSIAREEMRQTLGLGAQYTLGHVARFSLVKNQTFILDIFYELKKQLPDIKLILVGEGQLLEEVKEKARKLGLQKDVIFTGARGDVHRLMQAMDIYLFPSTHEGLPVVAIEAQAASLPCLFSDRITDEVVLTDSALLLPIDKGVTPWVDEILRQQQMPVKTDNHLVIKNKGYDIATESARLMELYQAMLEGAA